MKNLNTLIPHFSTNTFSLVMDVGTTTILPGNVNRFSLILYPDTVGNQIMAFSIEHLDAGGLLYNIGAGPLVLTWSDYGPLLTQEIYLSRSGGTGLGWFSEVLYFGGKR